MSSDQHTLAEISETSGFYMNENVPLKEVCEFMMRGKHPDYVEQSDIRVLNQKAVRWGRLEEEHLKYHNPETEMFENRFIQEGDIVINSTGVGTLGRVYYFREEPDRMFADSHITILRTDEDLIHPEYLYYVLSSPQYQKRIKNIAVGSTGQIELNKRELNKLEISFPDLETQKSIVDIIRPIERKIKVNRTINELLEKQAELIYQSWFIDFEPYEEFKNSEQGEIPESFDCAKVGDVVSLKNGSSKPDSSGDIPIYGGNGITDYADEYSEKESVVVIGRVGANCGNVHRTFQPTWISDNAIRAKSGDDKLDTNFLYHMINSLNLEKLKHGTSQPLISQRDLSAQEIVMPPKEDIERFERIASSIYSDIGIRKRENENLTRLKNVLLPELISGEIRVNE